MMTKLFNGAAYEDTELRSNNNGVQACALTRNQGSFHVTCLLSSLLLAASLLFFTTASHGQTISTVAGDGTAGYSGDGGLATSAELQYPSGVAVDSSGNFYIVSPGNNVVRKVTVATGDISTVAGGGTSFADGVAATSEELLQPAGIAIDSSGNLYIAETDADVVRKVTASTGIITTVAGVFGSPGYSGDGGAATSAELHFPTGIAVDSSGDLYIADDGNAVVRKVTASTGVITTYAGNGTKGDSGDGGPATSAEFYGPYAVGLDSSGNLYIADNVYDRVREVTASTGYISAVAGDGSGGNSGNGGAATSAELDDPLAVAVDSSGNVYIADTYNNEVREVQASSGYIYAYAGNGTAGFSGDGGSPVSAELDAPQGVALNSSGDVYIADSSNQRVREVVP